MLPETTDLELHVKETDEEHRAVTERTLRLRVFDTTLCVEISRSILAGTTYPRVPFIDDVRTVVDIGANIGAASVYFGLQWPHARVLAFEPAPATFDLLRHNLEQLPNATAFNFGLLDRDREMPLHMSKEDPVTSSVALSLFNTSQSVPVTLRGAKDTLCRQLGLDAIDILKIDTEGCELPILRDIEALLPRIRVIYLEYHDEHDRMEIDLLLRDTHILAGAKVLHPHRGELCYIHYDAFPSRSQLDSLRIVAPLTTC
jgi:FkbM family methyltransferase